MDQKTVRWPQYVAGLAAAGGALAVGAGLGWSSPAGPRLVKEEQYFPISQNKFDLVASTFTLGCAVSCLPIGYLMNKFGRKWTMLSLVVPFMIGWILIIWAQNFAMLMIGRIVIGLAGGAFCVSAPQYSTEIAEKEIRGTIGTFFQLLIVTGVLFVYLIGPFMRLFWTNIICALIPLVFAAIFFFMPESPVYLVIENRDDDARSVLKWLRGSSYDPQQEIDDLKQDLAENDSSTVSLKDEFKKRSSVRGIIISVGVMLFQQMSGINVVIFYATIIFDVSFSFPCVFRQFQSSVFRQPTLDLAQTYQQSSWALSILQRHSQLRS
jgi:SP family facilitated glucose transporter-like MFS transporter 8